MATALQASGTSRTTAAVCLAWVLVAPALAAEDLRMRPDPAGKPTEVGVGIFVIDVSDIRNVDQSMEVDFVMTVAWSDPRLADPAAGQRVVAMTDVWFPDPIVANERRLLTRKLPEVILVAPDGKMLYRQRFVGELSAPVDLRDFPYDEQTYSIRIVLAHPTEEVRIAAITERTGRADEFTLTGWELGAGRLVESSYHYPADGREMPMSVFEMHGRRLPGYYRWKVLFPLVLIVSMSWSAFWMDRAHFGPRLGLAATSMLTLIAYWFVLGNLLPRLSYLTRLDHFLIGSTMLVFLALVETVAMNNYQGSGREATARALDRLARVAFPGTYVAIVLKAFVL